MRNAFITLIVEGTLIGAASTSLAQCPFSLANDPTYPVDSLSLESCSLVSGTTYDLEVKVTHTSSNTGRFDLNVNSDASIRHLTFEVKGSETVWPNVTVTIRGPDDIGDEGSEDFALQSLESLKVNPASTGYLSIFQLWVSGDVGSLEFFQLADGRLLTGSVLGPIDVREQAYYAPAAPFPLISSLVVGGDILGDITFQNGGRLDVVKAGGDIGTPSEPVVLSVTPSLPYGAGSNIGTVKCTNLYADVIAASNLRRVAASGAFEGSINCNTVGPTFGEDPPGIFIGSGGFDGAIEALGADFEGDISITGDLASSGLLAIPVLSEGDSITITGGVESGSIIEIGGSLDGDIQIQEAQGLQGQILINAAIASAPPVEGEWTGSVSVGTGGTQVTIGGSETGDNEAPYYGVLSSTLGGGAIGLVPFNFHPKDSAPDHDSVVTTGAISTVQLAHYGPVSVASGKGVRVFEGSWTLPYGFSDYSEVPVC